MSEAETQHEHVWRIDYSMPTLDSNPPHYALECFCGATACGDPELLTEIHKIREIEP